MKGTELRIPEIESLNVDDIDVQDIERRLELAVATTTMAIYCDTNCPIDESCPMLKCCENDE